MTEKEKLGDQIRKLREKLPSADYDNNHISQQELADKSIGLTKNYIGTIERGEANPTLEKIFLMAKALNQNSLTLFGVEIEVDKFLAEIKIEKENRRV